MKYKNQTIAALVCGMAVAVSGCVAAVVDVAAVKKTVVFAVGGEDDVLPRRGFHRLAHHIIVLHAASVVREGDAAAFQGMEVHQFKAFPAFRDRAIGENVDDGVLVDGGLFDGEMLRRVRYRIQVGHGTHQRISAAGGGPASGQDGFLPGLSRFPEMDVKVNECGELHHIDKTKKRQPVGAACNKKEGPHRSDRCRASEI